MKKVSNDIEFTENFLRSISDHLSGRAECRHVEYQVIISKDNTISMFPKEYLVFPHRYNKHKSTKLSVISHVLSMHHQHDSIHKLVPGTYIYKLSINKKRRRWQLMI